ncbi:MAG TPA: oxidoreductase, partial [Propionibacteriaceae bacterium]|nr:oxidoreductase [Propionibacteriaceae bacterium]
MAYLVELTEPRLVGIRPYADPAPGTNEVLVRTWYSGISAGTELATYRGTNPYLDRRWDPEMALFMSGGTTFSYPLDVWGYSEVGVVEAVGHDVTSLAVGDLVWGMWGHRSHAVLPIERLEGHRLPAGLDPMIGTFDRVG